MSKNRSLTLQGMTVPNVLNMLAAIGMLGASIYLMAHFFQTFFPIGIQAGTICKSQGFFSCDAAAYSAAGQIFGIPNALYGILAGTFLLFATIFPSRKLEETNHVLVKLNALGCLILFLYSIFFLGHLCPGCTVYYIFSWISAYLFHKHSDHFRLDVKITVSYAVITVLSIALLFYVFEDRKRAQLAYKAPVLNQFYSYVEYGDPKVESGYRNFSSTDKFADAPLRISVFSDFQCPYCAVLAETLVRLEGRYKGKLNIQFYFYPLDSNCNPKMQGNMHPYACKASYLSACVPEKFAEVHDKIFVKGRNLTDEWLNNLAKKYDVTECMNSVETKAKVVEIMSQADDFQIQSTPTMVINGRKVEGALGLIQLQIILDDLLEKQKK